MFSFDDYAFIFIIEMCIRHKSCNNNIIICSIIFLINSNTMPTSKDTPVHISFPIVNCDWKKESWVILFTVFFLDNDDFDEKKPMTMWIKYCVFNRLLPNINVFVSVTTPLLLLLLLRNKFQ